ncbi:hypothetical protein [Nocardioides jiangxiensis]|uniref:DUF2993 domain-containing protein n=1 Tax=Nocardioides jiangxiensis TaxID=3064524 RepID=A0ABT9AXS2_9ACTN|nr:hypothetical protein [Nocardioides sp. WY-20]MDO7867264.1 hypothetical protein [Nocardioides sp. WY-20]
MRFLPGRLSVVVPLVVLGLLLVIACGLEIVARNEVESRVAHEAVRLLEAAHCESRRVTASVSSPVLLQAPRDTFREVRVGVDQLGTVGGPTDVTVTMHGLDVKHRVVDRVDVRGTLSWASATALLRASDERAASLGAHFARPAGAHPVVEFAVDGPLGAAKAQAELSLAVASGYVIATVVRVTVAGVDAPVPSLGLGDALRLRWSGGLPEKLSLTRVSGSQGGLAYRASGTSVGVDDLAGFTCADTGSGDGDEATGQSS